MSRLESWGTGEKSRPYFRKRLWGSWSMLRAMVTDRATWKVQFFTYSGVAERLLTGCGVDRPMSCLIKNLDLIHLE